MEPPLVQCQVCSRKPEPQRHFYCSSCARNILYELRLQSARSLLCGESTRLRTKLVLDSQGSSQQVENLNQRELERVRLGALLQKARGSCKESIRRKEWLDKQCDSLKKDIRSLRQDRSRMIQELALKRAAQASARRELASRSLDTKEPLDSSIRQAETKWNAIRNRTADVRIFLCRELASLCGLVHQRSRKGPYGRISYFLGHVPIVDLRDLNSDPVQTTVSLGRVAHFVHLAAHYLSVRLPAQIVLPSTSNVNPLILPPTLSYRNPMTPSPCLRDDCSSSRSSKDTLSRQHVLLLDKALPELFGSDLKAYSMFIESVTYLAWDIVWLARTQGLEVGGSWEDICAMGKILFALFGSRIDSRAATSTFKSKDDTAQPTLLQGGGLRTRVTDLDTIATTGRPQSKENVAVIAGYMSHASAKGYLVASVDLGGGADFMRAWHYSNPDRLIDKVKTALANESMGTEWEILKVEEWRVN